MTQSKLAHAQILSISMNYSPVRISMLKAWSFACGFILSVEITFYGPTLQKKKRNSKTIILNRKVINFITFHKSWILLTSYHNIIFLVFLPKYYTEVIQTSICKYTQRYYTMGYACGQVHIYFFSFWFGWSELIISIISPLLIPL